MTVSARRLPPLHLVTDDAVVGGAGFLGRAEAALSAGGEHLVFHLRAPRAGGRVLFDLAARLVPMARAAGAMLVVNDRLDVALASGADGAQVGRRGVPVGDARALLGARRLLGASVHSAAEAAAAAGADYLVVGTIYPSTSHPSREAAGTALLRELSRTGLPLIAIGGVSPERVAEVAAAGAAGMAVVSGVWGAVDVGAAVERYLEAWTEAR